ncbi:MAG: hypothetical protein A3J29_01450 [Acidobacteria bacterium RIFCSPLOWO2_12_FULL_67_14b]|nr:MAG: hypothetical protein A3J29_01450 [Acidobacteria bacterium RIFCSPLOWO2_12_FULL_67_14b]
MTGSVIKEARALLPTWAMSVTAVAAIGLFGDPRSAEVGRLMLALGSIALAALSIGHEYTHGTLALLLSLPSDRRRLGLAKLAALVPMLLTLGALALAVLPAGPGFNRTEERPLLSMIGAVLMAPWLTMLCRSPLAGVVFAIGGIGWIHMAAIVALVVNERIGRPVQGTAELHQAVLVGGLLFGGVASAAADWRMFMRLEVIDGTGSQFHLPRLFTAGTHPLWQLAAKELRLQHMTFVVAGLYAVIWVPASTFEGSDPRAFDTIGAVTLVYGGLLALLIGSLASAEERHLGTLEWQTLLPIAAWQQWAIKVGVVLGLTMLLSFVLPVLMARGAVGFRAGHAAIVVFIAIGSLFVSSRCDSALKALALSAGAAIVVWSLLGRLLWSFTPSVNAMAALPAILGALALWSAFRSHITARG